MKIKIILLTVFVLAIASLGLAQTKKTTAAAVTPDIVVKNLYATHKADKSPFFQTKNRALVDKYFTKDFADMIWNEAVAANGEVGALDFDPLFHAQTNEATNFKVGKPEYGEGNLQVADVPVTFKIYGKDDTVLFRLEQGSGKIWKISDIYYPKDTNEASNSLTAILNGANDDGKIQGELQTGKTESVILYVGEESGDYAAYCFTNKSEAGQAILAACKNGDQCEVVAEVDGEGACKVPGLEATLSASGKILKVKSAKSLGRKK